MYCHQIRMIRVNKPLHLRIIVSSTKVVHAQFRVVVIPAVPDGINCCHGAGAVDHSAPGVIGILCHGGAGGVYDSDEVSLLVELCTLSISQTVTLPTLMHHPANTGVMHPVVTNSHNKKRLNQKAFLQPNSIIYFTQVIQ